MTDEQDITKAGDQALPQKINRLADSIAEDAVIAGEDKLDHQNRQQEMERCGQTFNTFSDNANDQSFQALNPNESAEQYLARLANSKQKQNSKHPDAFGIDFGDGTIVTAKGLKQTEFAEKLQIAEKPKGKPAPPDGTEFTLNQLLIDYKTSFLDAYLFSKSLKEGSKGKSKTLETIVERLKTCPWANSIRIKFDSHAENPEYNPLSSTITINPNQEPAEQIQQFAHEGFHATHQGLKNMYMRAKPLNPKEYAEILGGLETRTFEAEIKVHNEITINMGARPVSYKWRDANDRKQPDKDLGNLYAKEGLAGLQKFILDDAFTDMNIHGKLQSSNYRKYYESTHEQYLAKWIEARTELERRFKQDPTLRSRIEQGDF